MAQEVPKKPENPSVAGKRSEVKEDASKKRQVTPEPSKDLADVKAPEKPMDNPEDLPDNEWSKQYYDLKQQLNDNPTMKGPLMDFALAALRLAAKYAKYTDMFPGQFADRVDNSDALKDKALNKEQADKIVDAHLNNKGKSEADTVKYLAEMKEKEKSGGSKLGIERAATKFVTNVLWNNDDFNDVGALAAHLKHTVKGNVPLYQAITTDDLVQQSPVPKGTLLVFVPNPQNGEKVVAYATGNADEFKYYNLESTGNPVVTFKLNDNDSPLKKATVPMLMILSPNIQVFKDAKEEAPAETSTETKVVNIDEATTKSMDKIDAGNKNVSQMIEEYKKKANPANLATLKTAAKSNFDAAEKVYKEVEPGSKSDEVNVTKLTEAVNAANAKVIAIGSTDADKTAYAEAVKKLDVAKKFQANFARLQQIFNLSKQNNEEAGKLK